MARSIGERVLLPNDARDKLQPDSQAVDRAPWRGTCRDEGPERSGAPRERRAAPLSSYQARILVRVSEWLGATAILTRKTNLPE